MTLKQCLMMLMALAGCYILVRGGGIAMKETGRVRWWTVAGYVLVPAATAAALPIFILELIGFIIIDGGILTRLRLEILMIGIPIFTIVALPYSIITVAAIRKNCVDKTIRNKFTIPLLCLLTPVLMLLGLASVMTWTYFTYDAGMLHILGFGDIVLIHIFFFVPALALGLLVMAIRYIIARKFARHRGIVESVGGDGSVL